MNTALEAYDAKSIRGDERLNVLRPGGMKVDLAQIRSAVFRSRFWVAAILGGCVLAGVVLSLLSTRIYMATASVQIDQEAAKVIGTEDESDATNSVFDADRFLNTQLDVIRSRSLAEIVAKDLALFNNVAFLDAMKLPEVDEPRGSLSLEQTRQLIVLEALRDNLAVTLPIDSRIATISFRSPDPELAAKIANSFAENYIKNNLQSKFDKSAYARQFLQKQLDEAAGRLQESESNALAYARRTRIIDTSNASTNGKETSGPRSLITATLVDLNSNYNAALARRIEAQKRWETARGASLFSMAEVLNNLAIQDLVQERSKLQGEYQEQLQRRRSDFPSVQQAKARIDELDKQINSIATGIRNTLRTNYQAALAQENELKSQIARMKEETLDEQTKAVQAGILQRQTENDRKLYDLLLSRFNELNAQAGVQTNNLLLVDRANIPTKPVSPNVPLNIALSLIIGAALSSAFVFGREKLFDLIRVPEDVQVKVGLGSLGVIPRLADGMSMQEALVDTKSDASEAFASLRSALQLSSAAGVPKMLMFTSAQQGEGKSSTCYGTAVALGRIGLKVVVIDLDLRRPNQHNMFVMKNESGMAEVLSGNASVGMVIRPTGYENVKCITAGQIPPNPAELLNSRNLQERLSSLLQEFDVVLVDAPPLLGLADSVEIGSVASGVVFVVEAGQRQASTVRLAIRRLALGGASIVGVLLSKFDSVTAGYGYEERYQYAYKYD